MLSEWRQIKPLPGDRWRALAWLVIGWLVCALSEAAILTIVAQSAAAAVDRASRVHLDVGPLRFTQTLGPLLGLAIGLVVLRLTLQILLSIIPARIATDLRARLSNNLFAAFTGAAWSVQ